MTLDTLVTFLRALEFALDNDIIFYRMFSDLSGAVFISDYTNPCNERRLFDVHRFSDLDEVYTSACEWFFEDKL